MTTLNITFEQVEQLTEEELDTWVYNAYCQLVPAGTQFFCFRKQSYIAIEDKQNIIDFVLLPFFYQHQLVPFASGFRSALIQQVKLFNWKAELDIKHHPEPLTTFGCSETEAFGRLWLKAFITGQVDTDFFNLQHHRGYVKFPFQSVTLLKENDAFSQIQQHVALKSVTSETRLCLCGCGSICTGRQKLASVACRKRYSRSRAAA
jgi:hypothetical protein